MERTDILFEIDAVDGKKIRLTRKQWAHISQRHPEMTSSIPQIESALRNPTYRLEFSNETIKYYLYLKNLRCYIMVAVKMLDEQEGFVMTAYYTQK